MRITQSIIMRSLLQNVNSSKENINKHQTAIATGKEVRNSSSNPVRFARASRFRKTISRNEQYLKNINDAKGWLDTTTSLLDDISSTMIDAKEIAIQAADESNNAEDRRMFADKIDSVINDTINLANSTYLGKYVFGGTNTLGDKPFSYDGVTVTYNGNSQNIDRRIAENYNVSINITGSQLEDTNLFSSLVDLRDALNSNDTTSIQSSIENLSSTSEELFSLTSALGSVKNQLTMTEKRLDTANMNLSSYLSQTEDVDLSKAITEYNAEEMTYKAALSTTSDAIHLNLLEFIR
ncbi:MAG: flagellar hook-associated protein 3 [Candidatus Neomarinimicrobiota bacterium]|nr:MAG: flagellar hook-associated protein 3 [Candidatus Neomarinimicrobiota bacterium]